MDLKEFKALHPRVKVTKADEQVISERGIDLNKLHKSIGYSRWLKNAVRLSWLIESYDEIIAGKYDDYPEAPKGKRGTNERSYTKRELDVIDDMASVEF